MVDLIKKYLAGVVATILAIALFVFFSEIDFFETWYEFSREHEEWDLDEIPVAITIAGLWAIAMAYLYARRDVRLQLLAREKAEALQPRSLRQFFETVEKSRVGMLFFDADGRLVVANRAIQRLGEGAEELIPGRTYVELREIFAGLTPAEDDIIALLREVSSGKITVEGVSEVATGERDFRVHKTMVAGSGVLIVIDDITDIKRNGATAASVAAASPVA